MSEVRRVLRAFHRDQPDDLAGEWPIEDLSLADLQQLFGVAPEDPMYGSFPVTEAQAGQLAQAAGTAVDLRQYDYFIEADAL